MRVSIKIKHFICASLLGLSLLMHAGEAAAQQALIDKLFKKEKAEGDSTEVVQRKPLESYFFDDSTRRREIFAWRVRMDRNAIIEAEIDTILNRFEADYPFMRDGVGGIYLGNLGGAATNINYFTRPEMIDFSFLRLFDCYTITPEKARHYNVKRPFTNLSWYMSGQARNAEEQLRVTHAQNITPSTGFNVEYFNRGTRGMYSSQRAKDKNLSFAVHHTGKKYSLHTGYIYNMGDIRENGGVQRDADITDTIINPSYNIPVNLRDARNHFKGNTFYITQAYGIPLQKVYDDDFTIAGKSSVFFGHSLEYTRYFKNYTDTRAKSGDFFENWFINPNETFDSINESFFDNKLYVQIQPFNRNGIIGTIDGGVGYLFKNYYLFNLEEYLRPTHGYEERDAYVYGSITGKLKKYIDWEAGTRYHPVGYRSQDMNLNGSIALSAYIKSRPVTLTASGFIELRSPSFWDERYFSNHFIWNNNFSKEKETRIEAKLLIPGSGTEIGVWQSIINDKIFYNETAHPEQHSGTISVSAAYLMKNFQAGAMNFNHRVLVQKTTNDAVIPLPLASFYVAYFLDFHLVRNILRLQMGIDLWYNTRYYAPGYQPAIMQFFNQREKQLGNYPFMDAFVAAKWKRMRILAKFQHVNENLSGDRNYFTVLHYPLNKRMFKLGFSWTFYD